MTQGQPEFIISGQPEKDSKTYLRIDKRKTPKAVSTIRVGITYYQKEGV